MNSIPIEPLIGQFLVMLQNNVYFFDFISSNAIPQTGSDNGMLFKCTIKTTKKIPSVFQGCTISLVIYASCQISFKINHVKNSAPKEHFQEKIISP